MYKHIHLSDGPEYDTDFISITLALTIVIQILCFFLQKVFTY